MFPVEVFEQRDGVLLAHPREFLEGANVDLAALVL